MPSLCLALLLSLFPTPIVVKLKDISVSKVLVALDLPLKAEGRIGLIVIQVYPQCIIARASRIQLSNDSAKAEHLESLTIHYNRQTRVYNLHAVAFGGVIDLDGVLPKDWK